MMVMRKRQILQQMMSGLAQRSGRNRTWHMMQQQQETPPEYAADDGPLTDTDIQQLKDSARTKYA
jgi:hypothetical protein